MKHISPDRFLQSCGAQSPLILEIEHRDCFEAERRDFPLPFAVVGRDERADLRLEDGEVSRRHAYLQMIGGRLWFVDLDSRTGTLGRRGRQAAGLLDRGHHLGIGPFLLRRADENAGAESAELPLNPLSPQPATDETLPRLGLEFLEGVDRPTRWALDRPLTLIGRAAACKVRLHNSTVSRMHCALVNTAGGLWAVDLLGRDGTRVNGTAVRWAGLEEGDELRIGQFLMRVLPLDVLPPPSLESRAPQEIGVNGSSKAMVPFAPPSALVTGSSSEMLLPLVNQFSQMQQQMFEQFQQTLLMVTRMFGDLHREQMQIIRHELDRVQEITRELQGLQLELSLPSPVPPPPASEPPREPAPPPPRAAAPPPPSPQTPPADANVHAWLSERLASLQQERQSRWQKILNSLVARGPAV